MFKLIVLLQGICASALADSAGFLKGNEFTAAPIQGQVRVVCNGFNGSGTALYTCRENTLEPHPYDYFVGPKNAKIDKVEIIANHEDGSSRSKIIGYDGAQGKSREAFNLWISTLFQKPLLEHGLNTIHYKVYSERNGERYEGSFSAFVKRGIQRQCPTANYTSTDINDCNSQYSICQRYFQENHNCL